MINDGLNLSSENNSVTEQANVNSSNSINNNAQSPRVADNSVDSSPANEKLLKQSEVNEIVGKVKKEAYEKARKEAYESFVSIPQSNAGNVNIPEGGDINPTRDAIRAEIARIQNESLAKQNEAWAQQTASQIISKIEAAKSKYPDIESVIDKLNLPENISIVHFANNLDNTSEVLYELGKNPAKYANVLALHKTAPKAAADAMFELSKTIKQNEEAKAKPPAAKPDSQLNHSNLGIDSGASPSIPAISKSSWIKKFV